MKLTIELDALLYTPVGRKLSLEAVLGQIRPLSTSLALALI